MGLIPAGPPKAFAGPWPLVVLSPRTDEVAGPATPLRPEEEASLLLRMIYFKHRASRLREGLDSSRAPASGLAEIERLGREALAVKNRIIESNLGLVVYLARRQMGSGRIPAGLVSEGNLALTHVVGTFDVSRGFKFSTCAARAIVRSVARASGQELAGAAGS